MNQRDRAPLRLLAFLLAFGLAFGTQVAVAQESTTPTPAETDSDNGSSDTGGNGGDNLALAVNTKDGSSVVRFAFQVRRVMNSVVDETNAAVAVASCEDCQTVAVAIQIVLIVNDPDVASPTNLALAYNVECTSCETLASAYQYVFTTGGQVMFSPEGWTQIMEIRRAVAELLRDDSLDIETIQAELDVLMDQLSEVLIAELRPAEEVLAEEEGAGEGSASPAPETSPESTPDATEASTTPVPEPTEEAATPSPSS